MLGPGLMRGPFLEMEENIGGSEVVSCWGVFKVYWAMECVIMAVGT